MGTLLFHFFLFDDDYYSIFSRSYTSENNVYFLFSLNFVEFDYDQDMKQAIHDAHGMVNTNNNINKFIYGTTCNNRQEYY